MKANNCDMMGAKLLCFTLILFAAHALHGQETITFRDGLHVDKAKLPENFRFIYNSDGDNMFLFNADTPEKLYPYIDDVAQAGATSFFISPNIGMTMNFPTNVGSRFGWNVSGDSTIRLSKWDRPILENLRKLRIAGHDPLKVITDRAREAGMEVFISFRLNEVHAVEQEESLLFSHFWKAHPEWRIGKAGDPISQVQQDILGPRTSPIVGSWLPAGLNFAIPEVREFRLAQLREICERYDITGLEIDFQRFPMYFKLGEEARNIPVVTAWMREVRKMMDEVGKKKGREIKLVARIMALPSQNTAIGLDPVQWAREGLLDFVIVSHYLHNNFPLPIEEYRRLLPEGFPVYASVEVEKNLEAYREVAYPLWRQQVDGLYFFNFFTTREGGKEPPFNGLHTIGYPTSLDGVTKRTPVLLVVNKHSSTLSFIDPNTLTVIKTIPTGPNPHEIAVTPNQRFAYLSNFAPPGNTISVIDLAKRKHIKQISTGQYGRIHGAATAPDGKHAYFTAGQSGYIIEVDTRTNQVTRQIPTHGKVSHLVFVSPDGKRLYTANSGSNDISILDRESGDLIKIIKVGKAVAGMAFANDGRQLWALNQGEGTISIIDVAESEVIETIASPQMPTRIRFTPDGKRALIAHWHEQGALSVIDVASGKEIKRIPVGKLAIGIGVSPDGKWAFVGCEDAGKVEKNADGSEKVEPLHASEGVHVINLESLTVEKVIKTGLGPDSMTICFPPE